MMRIKSSKLQTATLVIGIVIACLFWTGLLIDLDRLEGVYERHTIDETQSLAIAFEEQTERTFHAVDSGLITLARDYQANPAAFSLEAELPQIDMPPDVVRRVSYTDASGRIISSGKGELEELLSVADRQYFQTLQQTDVGLLVSPPLKGRRSGQWGIQLSRRLVGMDGTFAGVLVATIDPQYLSDFFARVSPKRGSSVTLVGQDGLVRTHSPMSAGGFGQNVSNGPLFQHLKQAPNGSYRATSVLDGTERFLSYRSMPDLALIITVGTSIAEALAPQRAQRDQTLIAAAIGTVIIGVLLWLLMVAIEKRRQLSVERDQQATRLAEANAQITESEERYRGLVENLSEAIFRTDPDGTVTMLNRAWVEMTGFELSETLDRPFLSFIDPDSGNDGRRQFEALLAGQVSACHYEARYLTRSGEARWIEVFARLVRDESGAIVGTAGTLTDVTDRREALDALRDSELRYAEKSQILSVTLENIDQGILMVAADGTVPVSNHRTVELLELPPVLLLDRPDYQRILDYEVSIGEFEGVDPAIVALCMQGGTIAESQTWERTRPNGRTIEFRTIPLAGGGIVRTYTDVTERRQGESALRQAKELAEHSSRARTAFLATLSHEIRTPLNGVIGLADLLLATELDPLQSGYVGGLSASAEHLLSIVDDVLDFMKLDADRLDLEDVAFDLFDLITGTIEMLEPRAATKRITIAGKLPPAGVRHVRGDPKRLRQILLNLAGNAVKFTDHGGVVVALSIEPAGALARIVLSVKDTGIGIPLEARDRLFQEFSQVDSSITRRFGGTGLGLAICKRLVKAMGGTIALTREDEWDTVFQVELSLPIAEVNELPAIVPEDQQLALEKGLRVLLVEDNQTNQIVAKAALEKYGCIVEIAMNGREAVAAVRDRGYDLVLMDLMMPEVGGLEAARQIRLLPGLERMVPLIAMSASASADDRIACAQAGMDGFIAKPFVPSKMLSQIRNVLSDRKIGTLFEAGAASPEHARLAQDLDRQVIADLFSAYGTMANTFVDAFMSETSKRLLHMDGLIAAQKFGDLVLDAHSLKGSALTFGCDRLSVLAGEIEHGSATNATLAWSDVLQELRSCFGKTSTLLRAAAADAATPAL